MSYQCWVCEDVDGAPVTHSGTHVLNTSCSAIDFRGCSSCYLCMLALIRCRLAGLPWVTYADVREQRLLDKIGALAR